MALDLLRLQPLPLGMALGAIAALIDYLQGNHAEEALAYLILTLRGASVNG